MGAPPGWGPNWKENEEKERYAASQREVEKAQRKAEDEEEKRGLEILKKGDLVINAQCHKHKCHHPRDPKGCKLGIIVESGYRSFVDILIDGKIRRWNREDVEVINENR